MPKIRKKSFFIVAEARQSVGVEKKAHPYVTHIYKVGAFSRTDAIARIKTGGLIELLSEIPGLPKGLNGCGFVLLKIEEFIP